MVRLPPQSLRVRSLGHERQATIIGCGRPTPHSGRRNQQDKVIKLEVHPHLFALIQSEEWNEINNLA